MWLVVRAFASQSVDTGFDSLVESKTLKLVFTAFLLGIVNVQQCSALKGLYGEQAGKFTCCVFGQGAYQDAFIFEWLDR